MKPKFEIITNNPLVLEKYGDQFPVSYEDLTYVETLKRVRDKVYLGHRLLTHPLSGSVKPNETPYKSVMVSIDKGPLDMESMEIIETSIHAVAKFQDRTKTYRPSVYEDFRLIDCSLIESAIPSATAW